MAESAMHECTPDIRVLSEHGIQYETHTTGNLLQPIAHQFSNYCSPCDLQFDDLNEFDYHITNAHKGKVHKQHVDKIYPCSMCPLAFRRHDHLKRHVRSLHETKKYSKCPVCGQDFQQKEVLAQHIKDIHAGKNEVYNCRECEYQCDSLKVLLVHELDHMDRHACPHCSMSYKRRDHLTRHVKSEHMKMVVVCPLCEQIYKRKDHLARHMREKHKNCERRELEFVPTNSLKKCSSKELIQQIL